MQFLLHLQFNLCVPDMSLVWLPLADSSVAVVRNNMTFMPAGEPAAVSMDVARKLGA